MAAVAGLALLRDGHDVSLAAVQVFHIVALVAVERYSHFGAMLQVRELLALAHGIPLVIMAAEARNGVLQGHDLDGLGLLAVLLLLGLADKVLAAANGEQRRYQ